MAPRPLPRARLAPPTPMGIRRDRVDRQLDRAWERTLTAVVAPAGAGKTTVAAHLVQRSAGAAAWYRAQPIDASEEEFCGHLAACIAPVLGGELHWTAFDQVAAELDQIAPPGGLLLVVDEFDSLIGGDCERSLVELLADIPPTVHFVMLSRTRPGLLHRLSLDVDVATIGPDDLRFRSWEIDQLFRDHYGRPLPPDQVAELERRSGGWVAALHLFDVATSFMTPDMRRAAITNVGRRNGPDWDYLTENVLAGLPDEQRRFLLETSPLERLNAELCDELLDDHRGATLLDELEQRQLVNASSEIAGGYRCHEVLRSHLEGMLLDAEGTEAVQKRYARAAHLLEAHGHFAEAVRAYCRADDRPGAARLLGDRGAHLAARPGAWLKGLPSEVADTDPWLLLARARQERNDGRFDDAISTYSAVERVALSGGLRAQARDERFIVAALCDPAAPAPVAWLEALRGAARGETIGDASSPVITLTHGVAHLVAGQFTLARRCLVDARDGDDSPALVVLGARLALTVESLLCGERDDAEIDNVERMAVALELPFFERIAAAVAGLALAPDASVLRVRAECERVGDHIGAALCDVIVTLGAAGGAPWPPASIERCRALGFTGLESWIELATAISAGSTDTTDVERAARRRGISPIADAAMILGGLGDGRALETARDRLRIEHSFLLATIDRARGRDEPSAQRVEIECFGGFAMSVDGVATDVGSLRPRARSVLKMLALHPAPGVHRDRLCEALWPDDDPARATKKLQVAISAVRRLLADAGRPNAVRRHDECYLIDDGADVAIDVIEFLAAVDELDAADAAGLDADAWTERAEAALARCTGELLPEDGPAEWLIEPRRRIEQHASRLALDLAERQHAAGRLDETVDACRRGLAIDRWNDGLWRTLLSALEALGDHVGHAREQARFAEVLAELGVDGDGAIVADQPSATSGSVPSINSSPSRRRSRSVSGLV